MLNLSATYERDCSNCARVFNFEAISRSFNESRLSAQIAEPLAVFKLRSISLAKHPKTMRRHVRTVLKLYTEQACLLIESAS